MEALLIHPNVAIIILNWNGWQDTIECLESVYQITYPNYTIILVDNGSEDDSLERIRAYCAGQIRVESTFFEYDSKNKPITIFEYSREEAEGSNSSIDGIENIPSNQRIVLIKNERNFGFAEGNNIGMRFGIKAIKPEYFTLLNNDTVVDNNFLMELFNYALQKEEVAGLNPIVYYYNDPKRIQTMGVKIKKNFFSKLGIQLTKIDDFQWVKAGELDIHVSDNPLKVDSLIGCCIFIRTDIIKKCGLMDERFFVYHEESDWIFRISQKDYEFYCIPKSKIWHKYSMSSTNNIFLMPLYYGIRNGFIFTRKNNKFPAYVLFIIYFTLYQLTKFTFEYLIKNRDIEKLRVVFKATYDGILLSMKKRTIKKNPL